MESANAQQKTEERQRLRRQGPIQEVNYEELDVLVEKALSSGHASRYLRVSLGIDDDYILSAKWKYPTEELLYSMVKEAHQNHEDELLRAFSDVPQVPSMSTPFADRNDDMSARIWRYNIVKSLKEMGLNKVKEKYASLFNYDVTYANITNDKAEIKSLLQDWCSIHKGNLDNNALGIYENPARELMKRHLEETNMTEPRASVSPLVSQPEAD